MKHDIAVIYRNKRTGDYLIQPLSKHPDGYRVEQGAPAIIKADEFLPRIADAVRRGLELSRRLYNANETLVQDDKTAAAFERSHHRVSVIEMDDGLEVMPYSRVRGGYEGNKRNAILVPHGNLPEGLVVALQR